MNKEIKIAIVVGAIMITACIVAVLVYNAKQKEITEIDLNVYKLRVEGDNYKDYKYEKCSISTEDLVKINKEYNKMTKIGDTNKITGSSIYGYYKITDGENFVAFDDTGVFFNGKTEALYKYNSDVYKLVVDLCGK